MKKFMSMFAVAVLSLMGAACSQQNAEDKVKKQIIDNQHSLTADERPLAQSNAKAYFEKQFPVTLKDGTLGRENGVFLECRPSDSNFNGLVTCKGLVPQLTGGFKEVTRYCGYRPELVGCSDVDSVGSPK